MITFKPVELVDISDAELVAQSLSGNRDAYGRIVSRYQSLICSINYSATGDLSQSEDIAQDTFVTAWKDLGKLREPAKLRSWLCRIARNLSFDALRKQGREPSHAAELLDAAHEAPAVDPHPIERAMSKEEKEILWRAIERIPEIYREPLVLFYREQQSVGAVAQLLELSEDAVKQRLARGRKLLQEQVLSFVEGALERSNPGKAFTASVLAALPGLGVATKTATLGATAAKGSAAAKAAAASGWFTAIFAPLLIFSGNYAGYCMALDTARTDEERSRIKGSFRQILKFTGLFTVAYLGLILWMFREGEMNTNLFTLALVGFIVIFAVTLAGFIAFNVRTRKRYLASQLTRENGAMSEPAFVWRTRTEFLGLPLVNICIGDRFALLKKPVKGWIAVGESALGGLLAFGAWAVAPISIGGCAIGLLPLGGITMGLFAMGGLALGVWSYGGMALGWQALGGCAVGWNAAVGGMTVAHDYALGGMAHARFANNEIAHAFVNHSEFFRISDWLSHHSIWMHLFWVVPMFIQWRLISRKKRQVDGQALNAAQG